MITYIERGSGRRITVTTLKQVSGQFDCTIYSDQRLDQLPTRWWWFPRRKTIYGPAASRWWWCKPALRGWLAARWRFLCGDFSARFRPERTHLWLNDVLPLQAGPIWEGGHQLLHDQASSRRERPSQKFATVTVHPMQFGYSHFHGARVRRHIGTTTPVLRWGVVIGGKRIYVWCLFGGTCDRDQ